MKFVPRSLGRELMHAARSFPAIVLTGPRRSGKTTLLRRLFPHASYHLLEDPDMIARFRADPRTFVEELRPPVILDEIQNVPEILNYVRTRIDLAPSRTGRWLMTGSHESGLMRGVTESMAGRAAVFHLLPFSMLESPKVTLFRGGFPEVVARPAAARIWFRSYIQTYLERDVRSASPIRDLISFRRFLALLASRCGGMLNKTDLAAPLGLSVPTISEWLGILEITGQIIVVPPFYENFGKRLVKSPKIYFTDSGLACHLLGIESARALDRSVMAGPLFEGFVASEIVKAQAARGRAAELYYFRDQQGLELDFIVPQGDRTLLALEAKAARTVRPEMAAPIAKFASAARSYRVTGYVVHKGGTAGASFSALAPGVRALPIEDFVRRLAAGKAG